MSLFRGGGLALDPTFAKLLLTDPRAASRRRRDLLDPVQRRSLDIMRELRAIPGIFRGIPQPGALTQELTTAQRLLRRRGQRLSDPQVIERAITRAIVENVRKRTKRPTWAKVLTGASVFAAPLALAAAPATAAGIAAVAVKQGLTLASEIRAARNRR